jgi:hypothetical protein
MIALRLGRTIFAPRHGALFVAGLVAGAVSTASAQYEVREWANFEDGKLPANALTIGGQASQRLSVVPTSSVTGQNAAFKNAEVGTHVLKLTAAPNQTDPSTFQIGIAIGDVLDRSKLGEKGRAVFQADFYFDGETIPSLAVLAMAPPNNVQGNAVRSISSNFYRFGVTKASQIYYSQFRPGDKNASVYEFDRAFLDQIPKPGWHRFALVCEGPSTLRCYVDGRETPFSPLVDNSMKEIQVGLLLADSERSYTCYADNLSIQVSDEAPALPASPYDKGWNIAAGSSSKAQSSGASTALPTANVTTALADEWLPPVQAWTKAKQEGKGLLLYFYAPGVGRVERINELLASDAAAKAYMARHACARVDVNQLEGGSIAKKYGIFKVPTFLVISPDAKSYKKVTPTQADTWAQIEQQLAPL